MPRWAVIRVAAEDGITVQLALAHAFNPVTMRIDMNPPASGPEWEFRVCDHPVQHVIDVVGPGTVLASKELIEPSLREQIVRASQLPPKPSSDPRDELAPADPSVSPYHNPPDDGPSYSELARRERDAGLPPTLS
jgi:hypothetical protein